MDDRTERQADGSDTQNEQREESEDWMLRPAVMQNAESISRTRRRHDDELLRATEALESRSEQLAHSLAAMKATLEATTDGILVTNAQAYVTGSNEHFARMWRLSPELVASGEPDRLRALMSRQFHHPAAYLDRIGEIYATWPAETYDVLEMVDGRVFERFTRIQFVDEHPAGRVWSFRDITERRRTEEALRDETRVLELLNRTGAAIASSLDLQTLVQAVIDAATELSGAQYGAVFYNTHDEQGDPHLRYTLSGVPRSAFEPLRALRTTRLVAPTFRGEGPIRLHDVQEDDRYSEMALPFETPPLRADLHSYLAVPVVSRNGGPIGGLFFGHCEVGVFSERAERIVVSVAAQAAVAIDNAHLYDDVNRVAIDRERLVDAERSARAEAERMGRMKDEFLATLSHELRTPLNAISGWSYVLLSGKADAEDARRGLEAIARNAKVQTQLIDDLLDMNRLSRARCASR